MTSDTSSSEALKKHSNQMLEQIDYARSLRSETAESPMAKSPMSPSSSALRLYRLLTNVMPLLGADVRP